VVEKPKGGEGMAIHWFDAKERVGQVSLTDRYLTLNSVAMIPFTYAYKAQVGINEQGDLVIEPLSKERVLRGDLDEYALQDLSIKKSYCRIASSSLMRQLMEKTGLTLTKTAQGFPSEWDEAHNLLCVHLHQGGKG
jgi:hypothetical protein